VSSHQPAACPACGTACALDEACPSCRQRAANDRIGSTLAGRYHLEDVIGRGGFGVVYRAKHLALGSTVAVKFLLAEWARLPETRARFEREANALVRLNHPGIVAALDFGEDAGDLYLVMEWVPGRVLADEILDGLEPGRIVAILDQVLEVLEVAHAQGIVHRDLKPDNIMLLGERIKVLDFGLVLISDAGNGKRLTASNAVNGTCYYMAPEQCRGRDVGPPADMYAMGCILFEMLSGEPPFVGETAVDVMMAQLVIEPPRVVDRGFQREPPPGLEAIARACLNKTAAARPTASAMRRELRAFLEGKDATTRAADATRARVAAAGMSRNERAIGAVIDYAGTEANVAPLSLSPEERPLVVLWGFDNVEGDRLRASFAMVGIRGELWSQPGPPRVPLASAVVIRGDDDAAPRTATLRAAPETAKVPILIGGAAADRTPALIRAGASDVALSSVGDDVLGQKLWRLIRRKR
jgi:hypothetical protein